MINGHLKDKLSIVCDCLIVIVSVYRDVAYQMTCHSVIELY